MIKRNQVDMGSYIPSSKEQEAYSWCIKNGIFISPKYIGSSTAWNITIDINKKINISPESYKKIDIWKKMFEYYVYYYDKYKK